MKDLLDFKSHASRFQQNISIPLGLAFVLFFFLFSGYMAYKNTEVLRKDTLQVTHTHEVISSLHELLSLMKDAETGQRGYLLTGQESYLKPYKDANAVIDERITKIEMLTLDNEKQQERIPLLRKHIYAKMQELAETIEIRKNKGAAAAVAVVGSDRGLYEMDAIRAQIRVMQDEENALRKQRLEEMHNAFSYATVSGILTSLLGIVISIIIIFMLRRADGLRKEQEWLQAGKAGLSQALIGDQRVDQVGESILNFVTKYFDAHVGAFFIRSGDVYKRVASYGITTDSKTTEKFRLKDGLLGQAVSDEKIVVINDVPDGYLSISSAVGRSNPRQLIIAPITVDGITNSVLELGFVHPLNESALELLDDVSEIISVAVRSAQYREELQNLLEETQRQAEELQTQSEELRVNNEELEEQSRVLKESQSRLEQQQYELEQTNAQLESQTQQLELQRDDLKRTQSIVQLKANELEQASQYKSDFLSNMSHELRTPLNSSLILAKLLADNPTGNLTEEQVKFAKTIQNSGNDLLALINDILDLSKIESGHMEVRVEEVELNALVGTMKGLFEQVAKQKKLEFKTRIGKNCPRIIVTDRQRLEQVLKNLLSNAIKFTDKGSIELSISKTEDDTIAFAVTDTGIGIAEQQQATVFEAFRQADGTISRKYGGTGLGLSISRELARLLGGKIELKSKVGKGSTFNFLIPKEYDANLVEARVRHVEYQPAMAEEKNSDKTAKTKIKVLSRLPDDRETLTGNSRIILVVEDDEPFAKILYKLAREMQFECLIANTAEEAIAVAKQFVPNAIVLDIGLPDNSGLFVLDRLKQDPRTRHIPVHVVSGSDYMETALSLGAAGYKMKPVKREELAETFRQLEDKLAKRMRRVLIVEDDLVQQESLRKLLGSHDVETVAVGTAAECLKLLKKETFDCMVLDLSLPDASGYSLLETLSKEDKYSYAPVIIYTGRDLSVEEEQRLRKYSKSIIIKGAKSPERLLDEVTLFLHQVVAELPKEQQQMIEKSRSRDAILENRRILVVEDDVANIYALTSILEPRGAIIEIARNGREAVEALEAADKKNGKKIDLVLMDVMMPEVDGITATRQIRKNSDWKKIPIIMLTAKAMQDDQEKCLDAGANDYMAKPLDVEKLLSLVRVWMPR